MATAFPARDARLSASIDRAFGELFTFDAMVKPDDVNGRSAPDGSRISFNAVAIWESPAKSVTPIGRGAASDDRAHNWTASIPSITIEDAKMVWLVQPGDRVTRQLDGAVYQVQAVLPDGFGRTTIHMTSRKR